MWQVLFSSWGTGEHNSPIILLPQRMRSFKTITTGGGGGPTKLPSSLFNRRHQSECKNSHAKKTWEINLLPWRLRTCNFSCLKYGRISTTPSSCCFLSSPPRLKHTFHTAFRISINASVIIVLIMTALPSAHNSALKDPMLQHFKRRENTLKER